MLNLETRIQLQDNRFSSGNILEIEGATECAGILINNEFPEVPIIYKANPSHQQASNILYHKGFLQFRGRLLTRSMAAELMSYCPVPVMVRYTRTNLYIGKGFLAESTESDSMGDLLFIATMPNKDDPAPDEYKFYINKKMYQPANKTLMNLTAEFMNTHQGDIIVTNDIRKYISGKIVLPRFRTLVERKQYMDQFVDKILDTLRREISL